MSRVHHADRRPLTPDEAEERPPRTECGTATTRIVKHDGQKYGDVLRFDPEIGAERRIEAGGRWETGISFHEQSLSSALCDVCWARELSAMQRETIWTVRDFLRAFASGRLDRLDLSHTGRSMYLTRERLLKLYDAVRRSQGEFQEWMAKRGG